MGFGFGGKTCPKQVHASDIFSLSGNMFDPTITYSQLLEKYKEVTKDIELFIPVKFKPVLDCVRRYAKYEYEKHKARNYY